MHFPRGIFCADPFQNGLAPRMSRIRKFSHQRTTLVTARKTVSVLLNQQGTWAAVAGTFLTTRRNGPQLCPKSRHQVHLAVMAEAD